MITFSIMYTWCPNREMLPFSSGSGSECSWLAPQILIFSFTTALQFSETWLRSHHDRVRSRSSSREKTQLRSRYEHRISKEWKAKDVSEPVILDPSEHFARWNFFIFLIPTTPSTLTRLLSFRTTYLSEYKKTHTLQFMMIQITWT